MSDTDPAERRADPDDPDIESDLDDDEDVESESDERSPAAVEQPGDIRYRLVEADLPPGGSVRLRPREGLTKTVYSRPVAIRYLVYRAKQLPRENAMVLIDFKGRVVDMAAGQTGRSLDVRTRRNIKLALVESGTSPRPAVRERSEKSERKTSRPTRRTSRPAKRR